MHICHLQTEQEVHTHTRAGMNLLPQTARSHGNKTEDDGAVLSYLHSPPSPLRGHIAVAGRAGGTICGHGDLVGGDGRR